MIKKVFLSREDGSECALEPRQRYRLTLLQVGTLAFALIAISPKARNRNCTVLTRRFLQSKIWSYVSTTEDSDNDIIVPILPIDKRRTTEHFALLKKISFFDCEE